MIAIEAALLLAAALGATRVRPPTTAAPPRLLAALAWIALGALGIAIGAIAIVQSEQAVALGLGVAGAAGTAFLWLARGRGDEDDDGGEPPSAADEPGDEGAGRFRRKRTGAARQRQPRG